MDESRGTELYSDRLSHLLDLFVCLPSESLLLRKDNPDLALSYDSDLLRLIELRLHVLGWRDTKDAKHKKNVPTVIQSPSEALAEAEEALAREAQRREEAASGRGKTLIEQRLNRVQGTVKVGDKIISDFEKPE